jgi:transposase
VRGATASLAQVGHNRDGDKHLPVIVYMVMTDGEGRPVAVGVYAGDTGDPTTGDDQMEKLREQFGLEGMVLVGDRGMLTPPQIAKLRKCSGRG